MKLSVIIPVYNEQNTLETLIGKVNRVNLPIEKELIVINDGSADSTGDRIRAIARKFKLRVFTHKRNYGKGAAVKTGIKNSTGDIIIVQDADLEYDPEDYASLIKPVLEGRAKVVYGSRRLRKENKQYSSAAFYVGGVTLTWFTNFLYSTKITDEPTCYKVFRSDIIKSIKIVGNGFEWEPEVTAKIAKMGIKIFEVPISYFPRTKSKGKKIRPVDGLIALWTLLKYRFID